MTSEVQLRAEVAALVTAGKVVADKIAVLRAERAKIQADIDPRVTQLNLFAKLGGLSDADKTALQQILGPPPIPSTAKVHAP